MGAGRPQIWRDWVLFAARWLVLLGFAALTFYVQGNVALFGDTRNPLLIAAGANILFALILLSQVRALVYPTLLLTDWLLLSALTWFTRDYPQLTVSLVAIFALLTLFHPNPLYTIIQTFGCSLIALFVLQTNGKISGVQGLFASDLGLPVLGLLVFLLLTWLASYSLDRQTAEQNRMYARIAEHKSQQLDEVRERTRAIYDMMMMFSETQHFERIVNGALDAGQLGLRGRIGRELTAAVLLFESDQPGLRVIAGRRFTRTDLGQIVPGKSGIIANSLREATPIIGGKGKDDPELSYFMGFERTRSTLCVPLRAGYDNFGVLIYGSEMPSAFTDEHMELLTAIGVQATIALQNYVLYQTLLTEKDRIARVAEDERKQLARQLHDGPTQKVSALAMMTNIIHKMLEKAPDQVPGELAKMEEIARSTTKEMRHMLFTLRPLVLESQGLKAALEQLAEKNRETHNQNVHVSVGKDVEAFLDTQQQTTVFYLVEEAINNARKHAQAKVINVSVERHGRELAIEIADDGVGFDMEKVNSGYNRRGSLGMVNMRERAALLDGNLHIDSKPGKGTKITIIAPLYTIQHDENSIGSDEISDFPIEKLKVATARTQQGRNGREASRND
jgi:signal transduction histidine kinase